jgi:hypothetical protein
VQVEGVMKKLGNSSASQFCRRLSTDPGHRRMQELAYEMRQSLKSPHKIPARGARLSRRYNIPLHYILLALGYESSLVEMLGQRHPR